jgi:hypothetical protein
MEVDDLDDKEQNSLAENWPARRTNGRGIGSGGRTRLGLGLGLRWGQDKARTVGFEAAARMVVGMRC